uniref:Uncharacterized protein n=1 Tax=Arundo donax TaxID=35708 RepID=A0A0A9FC39_ARUDO
MHLLLFVTETVGLTVLYAVCGCIRCTFTYVTSVFKAQEDGLETIASKYAFYGVDVVLARFAGSRNSVQSHQQGVL